jgi:peroxiredoxin
MSKRTRISAAVVVAAVMLEAWALFVVGASPARWRSGLVAREEPAARAVYDEMIQTLREAQSLSYKSMCSSPDGRVSAYEIVQKKPAACRVDVANLPSGKTTTLLNDGEHLRIFWAGSRPYLTIDDYDSYERTRSDVYIQKAALTGQHSVRDEIAGLGLAWYAPVLDPTVFHGYTDPLEAHIDGIRGRGTQRLGAHECDIIEVTYMNAQRTRHIWLSRADHLPRRIKEIVREEEVRVRLEEWSGVVVNPGIGPEELAWSPPDRWRQWCPPNPEDFLLKPGQEVPDFELPSAEGSSVRLSAYRGRVVWLCFWRTGSPACRAGLSHVQLLFGPPHDDSVAVLGFNSGDNARIAKAFLDESDITFPTVLESSPSARDVLEAYGNKADRVPLTYIIDRTGRCVDAWFGCEPVHPRAAVALEEAGLELSEL